MYRASTAQPNQCKHVIGSTEPKSNSLIELWVIYHATYISGTIIRLKQLPERNAHWLKHFSFSKRPVVLLSHFYSWWELQDKHSGKQMSFLLVLLMYLQAKSISADNVLCTYLSVTIVPSEHILFWYRQIKRSVSGKDVVWQRQTNYIAWLISTLPEREYFKLFEALSWLSWEKQEVHRPQSAGPVSACLLPSTAEVHLHKQGNRT